MDFQEWQLFYHRILKDFRFDRIEDERSADVLNDIIDVDQILSDEELSMMIGNEVTIFGGGPNLEDQIKKAEPRGTLISAGSATSVIMKHSIRPEIFVTDLDGDVESEIEANREGAVGVILGHGDNLGSVRRYVPMFPGCLIPTTHSAPHGHLRNYGGFTDGDRAVCLARQFGAKKITLLGFDFSNPRMKEGTDLSIKKRKLDWARRIIFELNPEDVSLIIP